MVKNEPPVLEAMMPGAPTTITLKVGLVLIFKQFYFLSFDDGKSLHSAYSCLLFFHRNSNIIAPVGRGH